MNVFHILTFSIAAGFICSAIHRLYATIDAPRHTAHKTDQPMYRDDEYNNDNEQ